MSALALGDLLIAAQEGQKQEEVECCLCLCVR